MNISIKAEAKTRRSPSTSGPLADLEAQVKPAWWNEIFDELYLKTDGDVVENEDITRREIDLFLELLPLDKDARILDLCCGQGRHSLELARRGYTDVTGVDRSGFLLNEARARSQAAALPVQFHEADARGIPDADASFDAVLVLGNSFGYFENASDDEAMLREVKRVLRQSGRFLLGRERRSARQSQFRAAIVGVDRRGHVHLPRAHLVRRRRSADLTRTDDAC